MIWPAVTSLISAPTPFPSLTPWQPQWQLYYSTNRPGTFPPQDLCIWYSHWNALPPSNNLISLRFLLKSQLLSKAFSDHHKKISLSLLCCLSLIIFWHLKVIFPPTSYYEKFREHINVGRITQQTSIYPYGYILQWTFSIHLNIPIHLIHIIFQWLSN